MYRAILFSSLMAGCAGPMPKVIKYETTITPFSIVIASQGEVRRSCGTGCRADVPAYWRGGRVREIWISYDSGIRELVHELCHAAGNPESYCIREATP